MSDTKQEMLSKQSAQFTSLNAAMHAHPGQRMENFTKCLNAVTAAISPEAVWEAVVSTFQTLFQPKHMAFFAFQADQQTLVCKFTHNLEHSHVTVDLNQMEGHPFTKALVQQTAVTFHPHHHLDEASSANFRLCVDHPHVRTVAIFPIPSHFNEYGVFVVCHDQERPYSQHDLHIGQTVVHTAATMLRSLAYKRESEQTLLREQRLNEMSRQLNESLDMPTILLSVIKLASDLINADAGLLGLLIDNEIMTFYPHNIPFSMSLRPAAKGRGVAWQIVQTNQSVLLNDYMQHPQAQEKWKVIGISAFIGVPIATTKASLGALTLFKLRPDKPFTKRDLALAESIGRQAAVAIEHARMFAEANQRTTALANALNRQEELDQLKNQFIQTVSHELRSPLGIIYGHAELLASGDMGPMEPAQQESVNIILRRTHMLTDLVDDLTALMAAETQEFRRELINPRVLVLGLISEYQHQAAEQSIHLETEFADTLPWLHGDTTQLRRVFDNLLSNAFKYTPAGGRVKISMKQKNDKLLIDVQDDGEGIAPEKLPRIFERFYQVTDANHKPRRQGTGLGLALVKEIVEAHRGNVSVQSTVGEGSTFHILLPGVPPPDANAVDGIS